jgi:hypothetical protein
LGEELNGGKGRIYRPAQCTFALNYLHAGRQLAPNKNEQLSPLAIYYKIIIKSNLASQRASTASHLLNPTQLQVPEPYGITGQSEIIYIIPDSYYYYH